MEEKSTKKEIKQLKESSSKNLLKIFLFIAGILTLLVLLYKIAIADINFDFSKFDFNAVLALILSLFAIWLSVAFYFKANESSNLFYDNTYKFTKDISEILGRIEAGFGERLRHLDEGYSGLMNRFDNGYSEENNKETKEELEKEKEKLKQEILERNEILNSLIEKAQLQEHEKTEIRNQLKEKETEISKQNREINFLRNQLRHNVDSEIETQNDDSFNERFLREYIQSKNINPNQLKDYPLSMINRKYKIDLNNFSTRMIKNLINFNIIDEDGNFTIHSIRMMRNIARKMTE